MQTLWEKVAVLSAGGYFLLGAQLLFMVVWVAAVAATFVAAVAVYNELA